MAGMFPSWVEALINNNTDVNDCHMATAVFYLCVFLSLLTTTAMKLTLLSSGAVYEKKNINTHES